MWSDLEKGFQIAFDSAWNAYKNNTIPIGAAILDNQGNLMATGQNQIYSPGDGPIQFHKMAHAEINAILKLSTIQDSTINDYIKTFTLYSTMEPCPLCFGAIVIGNIRNLKYAARDSYGGATSLNQSLDHIKNKNITITGPIEEAEIVQIAMQTCHELRSSTQNNQLPPDSLFQSWMADCKKGVLLGRHLYENNILQNMAHCAFEDVYNHIVAIANQGR